MGKLPAVPGPHLQAKRPWLGKNRHKIENGMCRITYPRWAALHHSPQKHSFATGKILIQAGCWCIQGSSLWLVPLNCRRWEREDNPQAAYSESPAAASALGHHPCGPTVYRETCIHSCPSCPSLLLKSPQQTWLPVLPLPAGTRCLWVTLKKTQKLRKSVCIVALQYSPHPKGEVFSFRSCGAFLPLCAAVRSLSRGFVAQLLGCCHHPVPRKGRR